MDSVRLQKDRQHLEVMRKWLSRVPAEIVVGSYVDEDPYTVNLLESNGIIIWIFKYNVLGANRSDTQVLDMYKT